MTVDETAAMLLTIERTEGHPFASTAAAARMAIVALQGALGSAKGAGERARIAIAETRAREIAADNVRHNADLRVKAAHNVLRLVDSLLPAMRDHLPVDHSAEVEMLAKLVNTLCNPPAPSAKETPK